MLVELISANEAKHKMLTIKEIVFLMENMEFIIYPLRSVANENELSTLVQIQFFYKKSKSILISKLCIQGKTFIKTFLVFLWRNEASGAAQKANYKFLLKRIYLSQKKGEEFFSKNHFDIIIVGMQNNKYFIINEKCPKRFTWDKKNNIKKHKNEESYLTFFHLFAFDFEYNLKNHHLLSDDDVFGEVFA